MNKNTVYMQDKNQPTDVKRICKEFIKLFLKVCHLNINL